MKIIIPIILLILCVAGIAIKILLKKMVNLLELVRAIILLKKEEPCQFCGAKPDEKCKKE